MNINETKEAIAQIKSACDLINARVKEIEGICNLTDKDMLMVSNNLCDLDALTDGAYEQIGLDAYGDPMPMQPDSSDIAQMRE